MRHPQGSSGRLTHGRGTFLLGGGPTFFFVYFISGRDTALHGGIYTRIQLHGIRGFGFRFVSFRSLALAGVVGYLIRLLGSVSGSLTSF